VKKARRISNFHAAGNDDGTVKNLFAALLGAVAVATVSGAATCRAEPPATDDRALFTPTELAAIYRHSPLGPLPADPTDRVADDPRAAALGQFLFFDSRLSANGKVSCATCHQASHAFTDGKPVATGVGPGTRNSPTVVNAAYNQWYFLDGRSDSLWSQALQPLENPAEMGGDRLHIVLLVAQDPASRSYEQVFGPMPDFGAMRLRSAHARPGSDPRAPEVRAWSGLGPADRQAIDRTFANLGKAIEAYERRLVSRPAPFDRYVAALKRADRQQQRILSPAAKRGLKLFVGSAHCDLCHSGPTFSDGQFHNLGLAPARDPGRAVGIRLLRADPFNSAGAFSDAPDESSRRDRLSFLPDPDTQLGAFKTPSLREVGRTTPYMHDGRFNDLAQVMSFYAGEDLARHRGAMPGQREGTLDLVPHLSPAQQLDLVAFLRTLTGPALPAELTHTPAHP
jgi:cytochrome c peroxidase